MFVGALNVCIMICIKLVNAQVRLNNKVHTLSVTGTHSMEGQGWKRETSNIETIPSLFTFQYSIKRLNLKE